MHAVTGKSGNGSGPEGGVKWANYCNKIFISVTAEFKEVDTDRPNRVSHRIQEAANKENSEVITIFFTKRIKNVDYERVLDAVSAREEKGFFRGKYDLLYFASGNDLLGINSGTASPNEESGSTRHAPEPITGSDHAAQENPSISGEAESTTIFPATEEDEVFASGPTRHEIVSDPVLLKTLEEAETFKAYRTMQWRDGKLLPPIINGDLTEISSY